MELLDLISILIKGAVNMNKISNSQLPKGVYFPTYPVQIKLSLAAAVVSFIFGIFYEPFLIVPPICIMIFLGIICYNNEVKSTYYLRSAINKYVREDFKKSLALSKKALKYNKNLSSANILITLSRKKGNL